MTPIDRVAHLNRWRHRSLTEKASLALGMLLLALILPPFPAAPLIAAIMAAAAMLGARVPPKVWLACVLAPAGFLATGVLPLLVQVDQGGLSLAPHGLPQAAALAARSLAGVTCLLFLALTTPVTDLMSGLRRLGLPAELADVGLLMYRFVFLLADTAAAMHAAQAARLGHAGWRRRLRSLGRLIANLLPRALDRARRMEVGLAARGWTGAMPVLSVRPRVSPTGLATVIAVLVGVAAAGVLFA